MTGWQDELLPASFRGLEFYVTAADCKDGRRLAVHQYAGRDLPFAEDLGRQGATYTFDAFIVGDDWLNRSIRFENALDEAGPATLVHPWLGELNAAVADYSNRYSTRSGGVAEFTITFQETVDPTYPAAAADQTAAVDAAALSADEANLRQLAGEFAVDGFPDFVAGDAVEGLGGLAGDIQDTLGPVVAKGEALARWARGITATARDALLLVQSPGAMGARILGLMDMGGVGGIGSLVQHVIGLSGDVTALQRSAASTTIPPWRAWLPLTSWTSGLGSLPRTLTTKARGQQAANRDALEGFVRRSALVQASRAAARTDFATYDDAVAARTELSGRIDTLQETASPDGYRALSQVRAAVVQSVSAAAPELPRLIALTPAQTLPSAVVSYQTFGDDPADALERADQLVARNRVRHPLFVAGGDPLLLVARTRDASGIGAR